MLTALYPFIHSPCEDLEILLSAMSLKRLATVPAKIVIVGDKPKCWADLAKLGFHLEHMPLKAAHKLSPVKDVQGKLLAGSKACEGDILFIHDDMLVLQEKSPIQHEYRGTLIPGGNYWGVVTKHTLNLLGAKAERLNYECHTPVIMNVDWLRKVFKVPQPKDILIKSLYLNWPGVKDYHASKGVSVVPGKNRKMMAVDTLDPATLNRYRSTTAFLSLHHTITLDQLKAAISGGWV